MKICIVGDVHWCEHSSIVRDYTKTFSTRLDNLINSVSFAEKTAVENNCDSIIYLGDFFDRQDLNSAEIEALSRIVWQKINRTFLVGNHEIGMTKNKQSSCRLFELMPNTDVLSSPCVNYADDTELCFLPYILEDDRKTIKEYFGEMQTANRLIFSHNDIKDMQMGKFKSTTGFSIDDIEDNCTLFINGHLHNGSWVTNKILNVGNLTGQNFGEDASKYDHNIFILDTETHEITNVLNTNALKFYKLDLTEYHTLEEIFGEISKYDKNSVLSITCNSDVDIAAIKNYCNDLNIKLRINIKYNPTNNVVNNDTLNAVDHIEMFKKYILENTDFDEVMNEELNTICI